MIKVVMKKEEFMRLTGAEMAEITKSPSTRWSEYTAGKPIGEEKIFELTLYFDVSPGTLFDWIIEWRDYDPQDPSAPYKRIGKTFMRNAIYPFDDEHRLGSPENLKRPLISKEKFVNSDFTDLVTLTDIPTYRWKDYKNGIYMTESFMRTLSQLFRITPGTFLDWMIAWRDA